MLRFSRLLGLFCAALLVAAPAMARTLDKGDGIHTEDWFKNDSFLDLRDDLAEATAKGRLLVLIFEQPGCGACQKLHDVTLQDPAVQRVLKGGFDLMTVNMYGELEMTDTDGEALPEKALAEKYQVNFTPTTVFLDDKGKEVFRMPGYFAPFYWLSGFAYVQDKGYADPQYRGMFPRWAKANRAKVVQLYGSEPKD